MELVTDLLFELCVILDTKFTGDCFTNLESFISLNAALPLKAEPLPCCSLGHLFDRPDGLVQVPACLCILASSTADPHSSGPPEFACFGRLSPKLQRDEVTWYVQGLAFC